MEVEESQPEEQQQKPETEEEEEYDSGIPRTLRPSFPPGRVKRIVKLDRDIKKVNSEALFLISLSTDLFLGSLAERAKRVTIEKKKKVIRLEHLRSAARNHHPTGDFLLDCLPNPSQTPARPEKAEKAEQARPAPHEKPLPPGARRIDDFFCKPVAAAAVAVDPEC